MQPYIIFTLARTGSTTFVRILNCCPGLLCAFEPFSPTNQNPALQQVNALRQSQGLDAALQLLWSGCNGFKHVWHWNGWPFLDNPFLNQQVLTASGAKIILLHRRNHLRRAISVQLSDQMQLWTANSPEEFERIRSHQTNPPPLDIAKLRAEMEGAKRAMKWTRGLIARNQIASFELHYEDFFESHEPLETRLQRLQALLDFIGTPRVVEPLTEIRHLLDPAVTGFQNADAYARIPNIREVETELGSDEMGWVHS